MLLVISNYLYAQNIPFEELERSMENLEKSMQKNRDFIKTPKEYIEEEKKIEKIQSNPYTNSSKNVAVTFCQAYVKANFNQMLNLMEKETKQRAEFALNEFKKGDSFKCLERTLLNSISKCKVDSIKKHPKGYIQYIFKDLETLSVITVKKLRNKFVVIDNAYIMTQPTVCMKKIFSFKDS